MIKGLGEIPGLWSCVEAVFFPMNHSFLHTLIAVGLACNYLAFQVELFDDEYEANHPCPTVTPSFSSTSVTWESFDKDNAPEPFSIEPANYFGCLFRLALVFSFLPLPSRPFHLVRDKSPPLLFILVATNPA